MATEDIVERVSEPVTVSRLVDEFEAVGLSAGDRVIVHSSLSALGWVSGGAQAVVEALMETITREGTLIMPTHSPQLSDPRNWSNPPVPEGWYERIEASRPPFRPAVTPTQGIGAIAECFRTYPNAFRSRHPVLSFAAWGNDAESIANSQPFDDALGEDSPLGYLYDNGGRVLLLGVGHAVNTSLHLAEYRADIDLEQVEYWHRVWMDGEIERVEYTDIETSSADFPDVGGAFETEQGLEWESVGAADAILLDQPALVDFATGWFETYREGTS